MFLIPHSFIKFLSLEKKKSLFFSFQGAENNNGMNPARALPVATRPVTNQTPVPAYESFNAEKKEKVKETTNTGAPDYSKYYAQCHERVTETNYFLDRGLTPEIIEKFNLGYDSQRKNVIIPVTASSYIERATDPSAKNR